jgi:hypothetical protein
MDIVKRPITAGTNGVANDSSTGHRPVAVLCKGGARVTLASKLLSHPMTRMKIRRAARGRAFEYTRAYFHVSAPDRLSGM